MAKILFGLPKEFYKVNGEKRKVAFYGAGGIGMLLAKNSAALTVMGLKPDYYIDNNSEKIGKKIKIYDYCRNVYEIDIISPEKWINIYNNEGIVVVTIQNAIQAIEYLKKIGITNVWILPMSSECNILSESIDKNSINYIKANLSDELSCKLFNTLVDIRENKDCASSLIVSGQRYLPQDIFKLQKNSVIIDAGALDGDTALQFAEEIGHSHKHIYSFEPNTDIHNMIKARKISNHTILSYALSSSCGKTSFMVGGGGESNLSKAGSRISELGDLEVEMITLDSILPNIESPTYIKMDIEGSELEAIMGMDKTIIQYKPILAICIYHKPLDIIEIPKYLMKKYPFYKYYIRHHKEGIYDTVLYCVPEAL